MHRHILRLTIVFALFIILLPNVIAQEETPEAPPIEFTGTIETIDGDFITVSGLTVEITDLDDIDIEVGETIEVNGVLVNGIVIAIRIDDDVDDDDDDDIVTPAPEMTPEVTPEMTPEVTPEMTPEVTPEMTPEVTPEATPETLTDDGVIIVIQGPVTEIEVNVITIFTFEIELDETDPLLTVIQIGDIVRVRGEVVDTTDITIIIAPITIVFVSVDVFVNDGIVWRDSEDCSNPPPPWAPAHGWRARCEGGNTTIIIGGGDGMGMGMGDDDDD